MALQLSPCSNNVKGLVLQRSNSQLRLLNDGDGDGTLDGVGKSLDTELLHEAVTSSMSRGADGVITLDPAEFEIEGPT
jgi:hypothetical protein